MVSKWDLLALFSSGYWGRPKMNNFLNYILVWLWHLGHFQCSCGLWFLQFLTQHFLQILYTYLNILHHTQRSSWMSTQIGECDLPLWECACASHASRGPNKESSCVSVPHDTRTVCNGGIVCFTLHVIAQRLWVKFKTLQSIDYPCSLRLYCVCKDFTKY